MSSKPSRKICSCCKKDLPISKFGWRKYDGREHYYCRQCLSMKQKQYVQSLSKEGYEELRRKQRAWRDAHPEKVKEYNRTHNARRPARRKSEERCL